MLTELFQGRLSVNIIGVDNGAGLSVDARLIYQVLTNSGMAVRWSKRFHPYRVMRMLNKARLGGVVQCDINLFLEQCHPGWFPYARHNLLIPNPEWFREEQLEYLKGIELVLCKTKSAEIAFQKLGKSPQWIGFLGEDHFGGAIAATKPLCALHQVGRSELKGTRHVLEVWRRHPDWPTLTVLQREPATKSDCVESSDSNIRFIRERVSDAELLVLQQEHSIHILPSEAEGYGQSLSESLSVGAVVITTDAPPMNEIVTGAHGVVVSAGEGVPFKLGFRFQVDQLALEKAINNVLSLSVADREKIGSAARQWFLDNNARFYKDFPALLKAVVNGDSIHLRV